jgi:hypothetical protein
MLEERVSVSAPVAQQVKPFGIASDGTGMFWTDARFDPGGAEYLKGIMTTVIGSADKQGKLLYSEAYEYMHGIAVIDDYVYWSQPVSGHIRRAKADGSGSVEPIVASILKGPAIAFDGAFVYFHGAGGVYRAPRDGDVTRGEARGS